MNQNVLKWINATHNKQQPFTVNYFLTISTIKQVLTIPLLKEEAFIYLGIPKLSLTF